MRFGEASFSASEKYVCVLRGTTFTFVATRLFGPNGPVRAVQIVEALTAATKPEDLADAFAWLENALTAKEAHDVLQLIRHRSRLLYGCTSPQGSIPVPTRALNTEVAYMMMCNLRLAFDIRMTGLRSATHLNGREGVIRGPDPADEERRTARLDDGTCVSVKAANFLHVRRGDYRRVSP